MAEEEDNFIYGEDFTDIWSPERKIYSLPGKNGEAPKPLIVPIDLKVGASFLISLAVLEIPLAMFYPNVKAMGVALVLAIILAVPFARAKINGRPFISNAMAIISYSFRGKIKNNLTTKSRQRLFRGEFSPRVFFKNLRK